MNYIINNADKCFLKVLTKKKLNERRLLGNHFTPPLLLFRKITIDELICNAIVKIINHTRVVIPLYESQEATNQNYITKFEGKVDGIIFALASKAHYENLGFFEFLSLILLRLTQSHAFENGNKRTGFLTFWLLTTASGLEFNFENFEEQIHFWEELLLTCASQNSKDPVLSQDEVEINFIKTVLTKLQKITFYKQEKINDISELDNIENNNLLFIQKINEILSEELPNEVIDTLKILSTK